MSPTRDEEIANLEIEIKYLRRRLEAVAGVLRRCHLTLRQHNPELWKQAKKALGEEPEDG